MNSQRNSDATESGAVETRIEREGEELTTGALDRLKAVQWSDIAIPFLAIFTAQGVRVLPRVKNDLNASDEGLRRSTRWRLALIMAVVALLLVNWAYELNVDTDKLRLLFSPGGSTARFTY